MNDNTMNSQFDESDQPGQSIEEIMQIIAEATVPPAGTQNLNHYLTGENNTKWQIKTFQFLVCFLVLNVWKKVLNNGQTGSLDYDDMEEDLESDLDDLDIDSSGEIVYAMWYDLYGFWYKNVNTKKLKKK